MKKLMILFAIGISTVYTASATKFIITSSGTSFVPDEIQIHQGDTVLFSLASNHNAVEVSEATWDANGTASNGGFSLPMGGGTVVNLSVGKHFYVCTPHASSGMKGKIEVLDAVDIKEFPMPAGFSVFPNPFRENVQVRFMVNNINTDYIEIYNLAGQSVYKSTAGQEGVMNTLNIDMGDLSEGIYFVLVRQNGERRTEKIVKY